MSALENDHPSAETLSSFYDRQLGSRLQEIVAAHVEGCEPCGLELRRLEAMSEVLRHAEMPALSQIGRVRLHRQVDAAVNADSALVGFELRISGIAAAILLVGSIWLMLAGGQRSSQASVTTDGAPPWVGVAVNSDADAVVREARSPAAEVYLADASSVTDAN
ncbi:MAG: hypothetical protein JO353_04220 [Phycisphaerae bacterium]|nr:hypothetical protein [Phycisphaerae bacterium]